MTRNIVSKMTKQYFCKKINEGKECQETDQDKFEKGRRSICKECRKILSKEQRAEIKNQNSEDWLPAKLVIPKDFQRERSKVLKISQTVNSKESEDFQSERSKAPKSNPSFFEFMEVCNKKISKLERMNEKNKIRKEKINHNFKDHDNCISSLNNLFKEHFNTLFTVSKNLEADVKRMKKKIGIDDNEDKIVFDYEKFRKI